MKIKNLFLSILAICAIAVSCNKAEFVRSVISVGEQTVFDIDPESDILELNLEANCGWVAKKDADVNWIVIKPSSGVGNANVKIYIDENPYADRSAVVNFYKDDSRKVCTPITINQKGNGEIPDGPEGDGDGTFEKPYSVAQAIALAKTMADGDKKAVYTKGIISTVKSVDTGSFGNAEYNISDDGTTANELIVYRGYYLDGAKFTSADQIKVGDEVVVYGDLVNFKGNTPEYTSGNKIVTINGEGGSGEGGGDVDPGEVDAYTTTLAVSVSSTDVSYNDIKVKINDGTKEYPAIKLGKSGAGGKASVTVPAGASKVSFYAVAWNGKSCKLSLQTTGGAVVGAEISPVANSGAAGAEKTLALTGITKDNNHYVVDLGTTLAADTQYVLATDAERAILFGIQAGEGTEGEGGEGGEGGEEGGDGEVEGDGDGTLEKPYSAAQALALAKTLTDTQEVEAYVEGIISSIKEVSTSYGNASYAISNDGTEEKGKFDIYRGYYLDGEKFTSSDQIKVGDEVLIFGKIVNYKGNTPQFTTGSKIIKINGEGGEEGGEGGEGGDTGTAMNTLETAYTTSEAIALINADGDLSKPAYVKGTFVKTTTSDANIANYKNMDIWVTDGTAEFEFFRCKNLDNTDFTSNPYKAGDELVALGTLTKFEKDGKVTYELAQGCYIVKFTEGEGGEEGGEGGEGGEEGGSEGVSLIENGGFESWADDKPAHWHNLAASNATISQSSDARSGSYSVSIASSSSNKRLHYDALELAAGDYIFSVWSKGAGSFKLGYGPVKEDGAVDTSKMVYFDDAPVAAGGSEWAEHNVTITLAEAATISLCIMNCKNSDVVLIDDVTFADGNEGSSENYTIDDINSVDAYYFANGLEKPVWDLVFYVFDYETMTFSTLGLTLEVEAKSKTTLGGTYTVIPDGQYVAFTDNDGSTDAVTSGTVTLTCLTPETEELYAVFSAALNVSLASGKTINKTLEVEAAAYDGDTMDMESGSADSIVIEDEGTAVNMPKKSNHKKVSAHKRPVRIVKR